MLQSDKAMLRLIVVLKNANNSFGDMQTTIGTLANQIRVFQGSLSNLKLAIGDVFSEPFRNALVYINAFIIAITKIIRAIKPLNTESETAGNRMQQFADDTEEAADEAESSSKLLDFDKFRTLGGGEDEQVSITETITAELQKQIDAYNAQLEAMGEVNNKAVEIAETIKDWFIVTDEDGMFVSWTDNAKDLLKTVQGLAIIFGGTIGRLAAFASMFVELYQTNDQFKASVDEFIQNLTTYLPLILQSVSELIQALVPFLTELLPVIVNILDSVVGIASWLNELGILNETVYTIVAAIIALKIAQVVTAITKSVKGLKFALAAVLAVGVFAALKNMIDTSNQLGKILWTLVAVLIAVAAAFAAVKIAQAGMGAPAVAAAIGISVGAGIAAIYGASQVIQGFAEGGVTDANFIMTHENGVREWVGKQGNSTAVVNDTQMSTVMSQSVRDGVLEAMSYGAGSNENINITVQAQPDGQKIYESTRRIARKNGEKFARV